MVRMSDLLERTAALHDHLCPRQVLGVRMGMHIAEVFGLDLPQVDKRLLTLVETDGCFADGVAVATGCWLGRRTLRLVDHGKVAATFIDTHTDVAVRIHPSPMARSLAPHYAPGGASRWETYLHGYQAMPTSQLLVVQVVNLDVSSRSLLSSHEYRTKCDACGEEIFNEREVERDGRVLCRACAGAWQEEAFLTSLGAAQSGK